MEFLDQYSAAWLAGLVVALLATGVIAGVMAGLLGVGGGIVIVPVLYHLFTLLGVDESVKMHVAVGTSLATIIPTSIMSSRAHASKGNLDFSLLKTLGPALVVGVLIGTWLSGYLGGTALTAIFAAVALLVAANMAFRTKGVALADHLPPTPFKQLIGTVIGGFSTLMGIGGGTLTVPILTLFNYPIHKAVGTAAAIGLFISVPGAIGFLLHGMDDPGRPPFTVGYVNLIGFILIVPMTMLMAPVGARLAHAINATRLRQAFALFLFITSLRMFYGLL
ncbi:sulfite exporter TauE/SafE family protein [Alloalcanivorax gelatiniphagus]|uniref:Probable membrane transporter protein n=1 Tax=Alloalcanivorax gelatiniphagus TaxID=1194167 RepID=A0ABY2XQU4_9GAMM|nr:sulfite exporter TauE/SafE family protein [Alloalcanivorax gelatiniphagus]TMW15290.1 sulfite exporter TauE/SafE family protein [Alloalcanivorax gelatiniphagus]